MNLLSNQTGLCIYLFLDLLLLGSYQIILIDIRICWELKRDITNIKMKIKDMSLNCHSIKQSIDTDLILTWNPSSFCDTWVNNKWISASLAIADFGLIFLTNHGLQYQELSLKTTTRRWQLTLFPTIRLLVKVTRRRLSSEKTKKRSQSQRQENRCRTQHREVIPL